MHLSILSWVLFTIALHNILSNLLAAFTRNYYWNKILDWSKLKQIVDDILKCFKVKNMYHIG